MGSCPLIYSVRSHGGRTDVRAASDVVDLAASGRARFCGFHRWHLYSAGAAENRIRTRRPGAVGVPSKRSLVGLLRTAPLALTLSRCFRLLRRGGRSQRDKPIAQARPTPVM